MVAEARLAHDPLAHHAPGHGDLLRFRLQRLRAVPGKAGMQGVGQRIAAEVVREGFTLAAQPAQLLAPFRDQPILRPPAVLRGLIHRLLQTLLQTGLEKCVDIAVQYRARVAAFNPRAQILDPRLVEHIGPNLAPPSRYRPCPAPATPPRPGAAVARARRVWRGAVPSRWSGSCAGNDHSGIEPRFPWADA